MPLLDGLQATKQIRSIERGRRAHDQVWQEYPGGSSSSVYQQWRTTHAERDSASLCTVLQVPIVGVSACSKTEQLMSATSDGLLPDRQTGIQYSFEQSAQLHLS